MAGTVEAGRLEGGLRTGSRLLTLPLGGLESLGRLSELLGGGMRRDFLAPDFFWGLMV